MNTIFYYTNEHSAVFQFLSVLEKELAKFEKNKDDFLSDFSQVSFKAHKEPAYLCGF